MKTKILTITLISVLLLSSINVFADGKRAFRHNKVKTSDIITLISFEKAEAELEIENWMTSFENFTNPSQTNFDATLVFESWMMKDFSTLTAENLEQEMNFESWMMKPFKIKESAEFIEEELHFESWMLKF